MPIELQLKSRYLSIGQVASPELPDFAVLTGRNGAGKTQLLQAIQMGHVVVSGVDTAEIELYDMASFAPPDGTAGNWQSSRFARTTARRYINGDGTAPAPVSVAAQIFEQHESNVVAEGTTAAHQAFVIDLQRRITSTPDFAVFPTDRKQGSGYDRSLHDKVMAPLAGPQPRRGRRSNQSRPNSFNQNPAALVTMAMKLSRKLPHELTYDDIVHASHYEGGTIANTISEVFVAYKVDQYDWAHTTFEGQAEPVRYPDLIDEYQRRNPPPWNTLRAVLAAMRDAAGEDGLFDFDFSDPAELRLDLGNYRDFSFATELTNRTSGARYQLQTLSSGERILMALCLASFNQLLGRRRPRLVLLDELDAVLHPSMLKALVAALRSLFVDHGCGVLMSTHSPMTVAALPETNVFRIERTGSQVRVVPTSASEAVEQLSEGIATVDAGLRIAASQEAELTILTEGNNTLHLKRWVELNYPGRVHVFDQLAAHRDKSQLLSYGRMLGAMDPGSYFVIVWDCDAAEQAHQLRQQLGVGARVTPFAFRQRENSIARRGIENIYDETFLEPYAITRSDSDGRELGREFPKNRKTEFANHVRQHGTDAHFAHYGELRTLIDELLASLTVRGSPDRKARD